MSVSYTIKSAQQKFFAAVDEAVIARCHLEFLIFDAFLSASLEALFEIRHSNSSRHRAFFPP